MRSYSTDASREPAARRGETPVPNRAPIVPHGPDKALDEARAMGNQAFLARGRSRDSSAPASAPPSNPVPASTPAAAQPEVDAIEILDSGAGATTGFPKIMGGADLNKPGEFNDPNTGEVANVHQIRFHLRRGSSASLVPGREVKRTIQRAPAEDRNPPDQPAQGNQPAQQGGFSGSMLGWDGPIQHEVLRPSTDSLVVADAPGAYAIQPHEYPFRYRGFFTITAKSSIDQAEVARVSYYVGIEKTDAKNIPNEENVVFPIQKRDLVNGRDLP